jgi:signal peptidase I
MSQNNPQPRRNSRSITFSEKSRQQNMPRDLRSILFDYAEVIAGTLVLALLIKFLFIGSYQVTRDEMAGTLLEGDRIFTNNAVYGVKIPFSDMSIPGPGKIGQNQIVLFRNPENPEKTSILRCVAVSGQTVEIKDKQLFIDSVPFLFPPTLAEKDDIIIQAKYLPRDNLPLIKIPGAGELIQLQGLSLIQFGYTESLLRQENPDWDLKTTAMLYIDSVPCPYWDLSSYAGSQDIEHPSDKEGRGMEGILENCSWLELNNILQFLKSRYPDKEIGFDLHFVLNSDTLQDYRVKYPCIYVMGDNWDNARDSRFWGFLSEHSVISRTILVYWSKEKRSEKGYFSGIRWKRIALFL